MSHFFSAIGRGCGYGLLLALAHGSAWAATCQRSTEALARMESARITLLNNQQKPIRVQALIADDSLERAGGYQHICPEVIARTAILFRYGAPVSGQFHMRNVHAPLDIGFFDANGVLIQSMVMKPYGENEEVLYSPMQQFQYALEARVGFFHEKGLAAGATRLLRETLP